MSPTLSGHRERIACDLLALSNGWNPAIHLTCHLGGRPAWDEARQAFVPGTLPPGLSVAGAAAGRLSLGEALADGARLGLAAASDCGFEGAPVGHAATDPESVAVAPVWRVGGSKGKAFVDFQNDVTDSDVELAHREGFRPVEHLKRYTTLGMATDQGKTSNLPGLAIMAELTGRSIPQVGTTVFRPPYTPVAIGALAGHHRGKAFRPTRLTPSHAWAEQQGAVFVETGLWLRAQYFPRHSESDWLATVNREVTTVRTSVGVCDVSTLGKIDIQGGDAAEFLDRVYMQRLDGAAGRQGALRAHAARGRLRHGRRHDLASRRRSFPDDHHDRQRRQGDAAPPILPSGAVAGARRAHGVGERAMGAVRDRRATLARGSAGGRRSGARPVERGVSVSRRP